VIRRRIQIWIEEDRGQTTARAIYGYSAFGKKKRVGNNYEKS
jgi:hypothetical protein